MIRGTKRPRVKAVEIIEPEAQKIDAQLNASIHNRFDIEVIDAKTGQAKQKAYAENVICNQLWTQIFSASETNRAWNRYIHYGSGAGTPSASDTSLFTYVGYGTPSMGNDVYSFDRAGSMFSFRRKIQLSEVTAVGATLTEVGIAYGTSSALCTHAMLKDMNGNQISIEKTDTDIVNIYATVFVHWNPEGYDNGTLRIIPYSTNQIFRWLVGKDGDTTMNIAPSYGGSGQQATTTVSQTFSSVNKTLKATMKRLAVGEHNLTGGIGSLVVNMTGGAVSGPVIFCELSGDWYAETEIVGESIGTGNGSNTAFKTAFGLASDATIYVDGIPETNVTVYTAPHTPSNAERYFIAINEDGTLSSSKIVPNGSNFGIGTYIYYNPHYVWGITSYGITDLSRVSASDDLESWVVISDQVDGPISVPSEYQQYKYWKIERLNGLQITGPFRSGAPSNNIVFDSPPANGAIITADYTTKTIAKDTNHVFDFECTIAVNEEIT